MMSSICLAITSVSAGVAAWTCGTTASIAPASSPNPKAFHMRFLPLAFFVPGACVRPRGIQVSETFCAAVARRCRSGVGAGEAAARGDQPAGVVGADTASAKVFGRDHLDQPAKLHDRDTAAEVRDHRQIVADEDAGEAVALP